VKCFQRFLDVFEAIEQKIKNGGPQFEVFTIGNKVKSEVKEELLIKAEKGERKNAFQDFLSMITSISVEIYSFISALRTCIMETVGELELVDRKDMAFIS
jgi:hypothetical protein